MNSPRSIYDSVVAYLCIMQHTAKDTMAYIYKCGDIIELHTKKESVTVTFVT